MKEQHNALQLMMLGLQHMLAMYAGAILVPLIVGAAIGLNAGQLTYLIAIDLFMCGAATLLQLWRNRYFGIGLPVVLGCTFTAVGPMISIGSTYGVPAIYGAIIAAGLIVVLAAGFFGKLACRAAFSIGNGRELQVLCFFCAVFNSEKQGIFHCIVRNRGGYQVCTKI